MFSEHVSWVFRRHTSVATNSREGTVHGSVARVSRQSSRPFFWHGVRSIASRGTSNMCTVKFSYFFKWWQLQEIITKRSVGVRTFSRLMEKGEETPLTAEAGSLQRKIVGRVRREWNGLSVSCLEGSEWENGGISFWIKTLGRPSHSNPPGVVLSITLNTLERRFVREVTGRVFLCPRPTSEYTIRQNRPLLVYKFLILFYRVPSKTVFLLLYWTRKFVVK